MDEQLETLFFVNVITYPYVIPHAFQLIYFCNETPDVRGFKDNLSQARQKLSK